MSTVQFTLNGQSVEAPAGKSIFNIAKDLGIAIPHLCHKEGLAPDGNCRACVVEVAGERTDLCCRQGCNLRCRQDFDPVSGDGLQRRISQGLDVVSCNCHNLRCGHSSDLVTRQLVDLRGGQCSELGRAHRDEIVRVHRGDPCGRDRADLGGGQSPELG